MARFDERTFTVQNIGAPPTLKNAAFEGLSIPSSAQGGATAMISYRIKNTGGVAGQFYGSMDYNGKHVHGSLFTLQPNETSPDNGMGVTMPATGDVHGTIWIEGSGPFDLQEFTIVNLSGPTPPDEKPPVTPISPAIVLLAIGALALLAAPKKRPKEAKAG